MLQPDIQLPWQVGSVECQVLTPFGCQNYLTEATGSFFIEISLSMYVLSFVLLDYFIISIHNLNSFLQIIPFSILSQTAKFCLKLLHFLFIWLAAYLSRHFGLKHNRVRQKDAQFMFGSWQLLIWLQVMANQMLLEQLVLSLQLWLLIT